MTRVQISLGIAGYSISTALWQTRLLVLTYDLYDVTHVGERFHLQAI